MVFSLSPRLILLVCNLENFLEQSLYSLYKKLIIVMCLPYKFGYTFTNFHFISLGLIVWNSTPSNLVFDCDLVKVHSCFCLLSFGLYQVACGIIVPQPGIKPTLSALEGWSLNHWTAKEFPWSSELTNVSTRYFSILFLICVSPLSSCSVCHLLFHCYGLLVN